MRHKSQRKFFKQKETIPYGRKNDREELKSKDKKYIYTNVNDY